MFRKLDCPLYVCLDDSEECALAKQLLLFKTVLFNSWVELAKLQAVVELVESL